MSQPLIEPLTPREREILTHLADGRSNREIADALVLSLNTVKWYARQIYGKLGVSNRRQAIQRAEELGLLESAAPGSGPPHNLPTQLSPFVGRREEVETISQLLSESASRLLTLVGPGGIGKTSLAIQAASRLLKEDPEVCRDGAFFVPLECLDDAASIVPAIAHAIGFSFYQGKERPEQQLAQYLQRRLLLLVLDNFEHLIDGESTRLVTETLAVAPGVRMLVTSRIRLNIQGEHLLPLAGMPVPQLDVVGRLERPVEWAQSFGGIQLFQHAARRLRPDFELTNENLMPVVHICSLIEGMPLGIELAAAWTAVLEPQEIATEIERSFDFLTTEASNVPERQRSLRAVFDVSWTMLTDQERSAIQQLAVFRGGFDRKSAEQVCGVSLPTLLALVNKSWIQRRRDGRYHMHELLRQYGKEELARTPALEARVRDQHSRYFCDWLGRQEESLKGGAQDAVSTAIGADLDNVRTACHWAIDHGRLERLSQAVNALGLYYYRGYGHSQPGTITFGELSRALEARDRTHASATASLRLVQARVLMWQSSFWSLLGDEQTGARLAHDCLALLDDKALVEQDSRAERAHIALQLGYLQYYSDAAAAKALFAQSHQLYKELDDRWGMAYAMLGSGRAARNLSALDEAQEALSQSLVLHREIGNEMGQSEVLATLGGLAIRRSRFGEAERLIEQSLSLTQETDRFGTAFGLGFLGLARFLTGQYAAARSSLTECIAIYEDLGIMVNVVRWAVPLARIHLHTGDLDAAHRQAESVLALARELGYERGIGFGLLLLAEWALAGGAFAQARQYLQESLAAVREFTTDQRHIGQLAWLGVAAWGLRRRSEAWRHLGDALGWTCKAQRFLEQMVALAGIALLLAEEGEAERAIELYALVLRHPLVGNSRWFEGVVGQHIDSVAAALPHGVTTAAQERGRARDLEATVAELLAELGEKG